MTDASISEELRNLPTTGKSKPTKTASMWDRAGKITVEVLQRHIDEALERNSSHCVIAMAISEAIPDATHVCVDLQTCRWTRKDPRYVILTPHLARDFLVAFDQGERSKLKPFRMRLRPCQITRAGKKRNLVPSNGELRGSGLTVAKTQLHVDPEFQHAGERIWRAGDPPPHRFTEIGERNLDPNRSDGVRWRGEPAARGIAPAPPRQPQAKVSTAHKGEVPTTLGGKPPPVLILSCREFGWRTLRR